MSNLEEEKRIKFPDQFYVGYRQDTDALTGFMTPDGTDSAAKKRMSSVDYWVEQGRRKTRYNTETKKHEYVSIDVKPADRLTNKAVSGFSIHRRLNRGGSWNGNQDKWKVNDPRGFQVEISGNNLQKIIEYTSIVEGTIQGECIWARLGPDNILVPVNTEIYTNATKNTERYGKSVTPSSMKLGDWCTLQNGQEGQFVGKYHLASLRYSSWYNNENENDNRYKIPEFTKAKQYVFLKDGQYFAFAGPKISALTDCPNPVPTEEEINTYLLDNDKSINTFNGRAEQVSSVKSDFVLKFFEHDSIPNGYNYIGNKYRDNLYAFGYAKYGDNRKQLLDKNLCYVTRVDRNYSYGKVIETVSVDLVAPFVVADFEFATGYGVSKLRV